MILTIAIYFSSIKIAQLIVNQEIRYSEEYLTLLFLLLPVWFIGLSKTALLLIYRVNHYPKLLVQAVKFIVIALGILFVLINLLNLTVISKEVIFIFGILNQFTFFFWAMFSMVFYFDVRGRKEPKNVVVENAEIEILI